jgi:hypothetical protein
MGRASALPIFATIFTATSTLTLVPAGPARPAQITTGATCSLVDAITSANTNTATAGCAAGAPGRDTIVLAGQTTLSVADNGTNGLPVIVEDLVITSPDPGSTAGISRDHTVGTPEFRLLEIGSTAIAPAVTLRRINLANGRVSGSIGLDTIPRAGAGGCVRLVGGSLTVVDSTFEECAAFGADNADGPAADGWGGAIAATAGSLTVRGSGFSFNSATGGAATGEADPGGSGQGGAIFATGLDALAIRDTTMSGNSAIGGGGVGRAGNGRGGALAAFGLTGSLSGSSFTANAAQGGSSTTGTSGTALGGAVSLLDATFTILDTELDGNVATGPEASAGQGGQGDGGGLDASASTVTAFDLRVLANRAAGGDGSTPSANGIARGGGLRLSDTTFAGDGVELTGNSPEGGSPGGGGIAVLDSGDAATPLLLIRSTIADNEATATQGEAQGGGIYQAGDSVTLRNTAVSGNSAASGGAIFQAAGETAVRLGTLSGNAAGAHGGAIAVEGTIDSSHALELVNATLSGNSAGTEGGGLYLKGTPLAAGAMTAELSNVTLTASTGGGVQLVHDHSDPELEVGNSIVGGQASGADCAITGSGVIASEGGNLESGTDCGFTAASDRQGVADLGLGALAMNGGPTLTHDLLPGSPAIDAGLPRACTGQANGKDQRGFARFFDGNGDRRFACDSGAVEAQGLVANGGFETPLDPARDWTLVASGGGDERIAAATPNGRFVLRLVANGALEVVGQTVPVAGGAGDAYALTLQGRGSGLTAGEALDATLETLSAGAIVDTSSCTLAFPADTFAGAPEACVVTANAPYDALKLTLGWEGVRSGSLDIDAVSLVRR